jgi:excinuclease ABC subunit A
VEEVIRIKGARTHNLKNISLSIQLNRLTCIYGPSGSGKSSLAFHTLMKESKRRYLNSFPNDVKFFWDIPQSVDVDEIFPVLPVWGLGQSNPVVGSRPVVADHLDIHTEVEKLFVILGRNACPAHPNETLIKNDFFLCLERMLRQNKARAGAVIHLLVDRFEFQAVYGHGIFPPRGYSYKKRTLEAYSDASDLWEIVRFKNNTTIDLSKKFDSDLEKFGASNVYVWFEGLGEPQAIRVGSDEHCPKCEFSTSFDPKSFFDLSPYNPSAACSTCEGHGMRLVYSEEKLVKDPSLSLAEGALHILNSSRFEHLYPVAIREFKKAGYDIHVPFEQVDKSIWTMIWNGSGKFSGVNSLLEYLETKRYKKSVRIYLRSLQTEILCSECAGTRLNVIVGSRAVDCGKKTIFLSDVLAMTLDEVSKIFCTALKKLKTKVDVKPMIQSLSQTVEVAIELGLGDLKIAEKVRRLLVGEYQRLLLTKILKFAGSGTLFILDEPTIGLSEPEQKILIKRMKELVKQGNTVLVVDHSKIVQEKCDEVIEMGPAAGARGGELIYQGKPQVVKELTKVKRLESSSSKKINFKFLDNNYKHLSLNLLREELNVIQGVFKSRHYGQFTDTLPREFERTIAREGYASKSMRFSGHHYMNGVLMLSGGATRTTIRSTVGTSTGLSAHIRKEFVKLPLCKSLGLEEGHFSAYSELGQCHACEGRGTQIVDMQFLEDIEFVCDDCKGHKIKPFYATLSNGLHTFTETQSLPLAEVVPTIRLTPKFKRTFDALKHLQLDYLSLDRPLSTLSGGERLRLKILTELSRSIEEHLIIVENLSLGLAESDLLKLVSLLRDLCINHKNTVVIYDESPLLSKIAPNLLKLEG